DDAGGETSIRQLADGIWSGFRLRSVRQHPTHCPRAQAGWLRLGLSRLRRRLRRLDDLVWIVGWGCARDDVSGEQVIPPLAASWLARRRRLCCWIFRDAPSHRLAS